MGDNTRTYQSNHESVSYFVQEVYVFINYNFVYDYWMIILTVYLLASGIWIL